MSSIDFVNKKPIALPLVIEFLKDLKKEERSDFQDKLLNYLKKSAKLSKADCESLFKELSALGIPGLAEEHIVALLNILPRNLDEIRSVLTDKVNLSSENLKKIQEIISKYIKNEG
ncbi:MAG: hypothetical protein ACP5IJ_00290 [Candidatus Nanoarchaeia archaeon]